MDYLHLFTEAKFNLASLFNDIKVNRGKISSGTGEVVPDVDHLDDMPVSKAAAKKIAKSKASNLNKKDPTLSHVKPLK
jgi:hypothetical protein